GHATESFSDFVVGHGELWSAQLMAAMIRKRGLPCVWMDTREVLVVNPTTSNQADPDYVASEEKLNKWYSLTPAETIVATVSEAVILKTLSYQEAWEMSYFGANVLHPRTIIPVMNYNIPIVIRNVFNLSSPGTTICQPSIKEVEDPPQYSDSIVKGFATIDNLALVNVEGTGMAGVPGTASAIFGAVKDVGANVIMISQASSEHSVCFAVPENEVNAVAEALQKRFKQALEAGRLSQVEVIHDCSILAAVGQRMASTPGVSATLFNALAKANINIRAIAQGCSEYNITVVVKRSDSIKALRAVHSRFYLSKTPLAVGIIGPGLIGGTLLDQLRDQAAVLKEEFNIDLRVMGIIGSTKMVLSDRGMDLQTWRELRKEKGILADLEKFVQHLHGNNFIPNTVIVDCTADSEVAKNYYQWLRKGMHIVTPNKKANSGPLDQ
ncbi:hypothetical protein KI387_042459, partial [Taxus chinensis]